MFRSLHTFSSVVQIKSTANIQIIRDLLQCYSIDRNTCKNFCLTIFMAINTNIMNETIQTFALTIKNTVHISKKPLQFYFHRRNQTFLYGLIKTLIGLMYRINSTWTSFDIDLKNLQQVLRTTLPA